MKPCKETTVLLLASIILFLPTTVRAEEKQQEHPQYKIIHRDAIARIVDGDYDTAIKHFENYLKEHPGDLESFYGLAVAYAQKKETDKSITYTKEALNSGLSFSRFLAGPRDLLKELTDSNDFQKLKKEYGAELLNGPMLGCVTEKSAKFWVRTADEVSVQVLISDLQKMGPGIKSAIVKTAKDRDFTAIVSMEGLKPNTTYYYELIINGKKEAKQWSFKTFPASGTKAKFQIGFGGGAGYSPQNERMWNTIASHNLTAFLFLGDNVYIDHPEKPAVQRYCYYQHQCRPEFPNFTAGASIYAIYDDHDFSTNDSVGGPEIDKPAWKKTVWRIFTENWNNPYYAGGEGQPGCWCDFSIGDVDFIMLDCRYYRTDPQKENPSMLGPVQKKWLFDKLGGSKATFKVLVSSVPWAFGTKPSTQTTDRGQVPGSLDTWEGFKKEREEIFSFIEKNKINGVVLLSADRHRSDTWKIERENGYTLYEFESSKLTNIHTHQLIPAALFGYNQKCSFGLLTFDTTKPDPELTYQIISIDNEVINTLTLKKSQLKVLKSQTNK